MKRLLFITIYFLASIEAIQIITTSLGKLRGITEYSSDGNSKNIFKGVPFAKAPIGKLRFELPQKIEPWNGVKDASKYSAACIAEPKQSSSPTNNLSEDCLYINIFTSERCLVSGAVFHRINNPDNKLFLNTRENSANCSVIIYYHGGGFHHDSAIMFPDKFILDRYVSEDIVFVIPAYRLGIFGLLNVGDENVVADNLGVHDCVLSLHFVHDHIRSFGGNENEVTIMGHSSGGTMVGFFAFSKLIDPQRKLFKRVIMLSGLMSLIRRELLENTSMEIVKDIGCFKKTKQEIVDCLREIDAFELLKSQTKIEKEKGHYMRGTIRGSPIIQKGGKFEEFFHNITQRDILFGSTEYELEKYGNNDRDPTIQGDFMDFENPYEVSDQFEILFSQNSDWLTLSTQGVFVTCAMYSAAMANAGGNAYLYETRQGYSAHVTDMKYFIGINREEIQTLDEQVLDSVYSKFITNFTKTGVPNQDWKPVNSSQMNYIALQFNLLKNIFPSMQTNYHEDIVDFWKINMTAFDRQVTLKKHVTRMPFYPGPVILSTIETEVTTTEWNTDATFGSTSGTILKNGDYLIFSQWWFYILVVLVILILLFVVYYICRSRSGELEPLLG